jgi:hypothetical protein
MLPWCVLRMSANPVVYRVSTSVNRTISPRDGKRIKRPAIKLRPLRPEGFEPPTYGFEDHCSIQLSYGRKLFKGRELRRELSKPDEP